VLITLTGVTLPFQLLGRLGGWVALAVLLGLGLGQLPLFGVLGYELAIAATVFATVMSLDLGCRFAREMQQGPAEGIQRARWPLRALARSTLGAIALAVAIILVPALICAVRGLWVPTCDWSFGILAYATLPVTTAVLGAATGHAIGVLVGRRYAAALVATLGPIALVAAAALWRFYSAPPVFTYNAILGYFPGNLYDENIALTATLAWSRLEQLLWVTALVALVATRLDVPAFRARLRIPRPAGRRIGAWLLALAASAGALALRLHGGELGYAIDAEDIETTLGGRLETEHFVIYYAKTPEIEADLAVYAEDHELRYAQVVRQIGVAPPGKIRSFLFSSREQKSRLMGARDVEMAKPWRHEIYLEHRDFPHSSLRHEIAHVIASAFGDPWFGVAARRIAGMPILASPGLIEGMAVALDWPAGYDRSNPHESVRAMMEQGRLPPVSQLFGLSFFSVSSQRGYMTAGSFLRFLLDAYGPAKLRTLYGNGGDFEEAYGVSLARLENQWRTMIEQIDLPPAAVASNAERFRGVGVFSRPCPHAIAKKRDEADQALAEGDQRRAVRLMRIVCGDAPEEPRYRMELGDMLANGDTVDKQEAERTWLALATDDVRVTSTLRVRAFERLVRMVAKRGDFMLVRALVAAAVALPVEPAERRTLEGMAFVLQHDGPAAKLLFDYFFSSGDLGGLEGAEAAALAEPALGFAHYLAGLQRANRDDFAAAAAHLERALARGLPGPSFVKNAARRLAICAYRSGDRTKLAVAITVLSGAEMSSGDRMLAADWADRLAFDDAATFR